MSTRTAGPPPMSREVINVLAGLLGDAVGLASQGVVPAESINTAMRLGAGHRQGPLELAEALTSSQRSRLGLTWDPALPDQEAAPSADTPAEYWAGPASPLGTGHMATGIAEAVAASGRDVIVLARAPDSGTRTESRLALNARRAVERGRLTEVGMQDRLGLIRPTTDATELASADVIIEVVAEDLVVKDAVLAAADTAAPAHIPFATNTSSFRVSDLRPSVRHERSLIALYFFSPAPAMKLVEIVVPTNNAQADPAAYDSASLYNSAERWVSALGKTPVRCADSRAASSLIRHSSRPSTTPCCVTRPALRSPRSTTSSSPGAGHPVGPLALIDLIDIDIDIDISALRYMAEVEDEPRLQPATKLQTLADSGRLGRKGRSGFHDYTQGQANR